MARTGRIPMLTPELQRTIITAITMGVPYIKAAEMAGIAERTAMDWMARGTGRHTYRKALPLFVQFVQEVKKAQAGDQARRVARIEQSARGGAVIYEKTTTTTKDNQETVTVREVRYSPPQWTADAWHLERTDPDRWGRRDRLDVHHVLASEVERIKQDPTLSDEEKTELIRDVEAFAYGRS